MSPRSAGEDRSTWSGSARLARLVEVLGALQERLDAEVLRLIADCDAVDAWEADCLGAVSWLASKTGLVRGAAARLVRTARFVRRHERTAKALDTGDISVPHVEMLAAAAHRRDDLYEEHETVLLDAAATVEVQDFPQAMRRWVSLADDVMARRDAVFGFDRRRLVFSPTTGGSVISGFADPEASATVTNVLDDLQPPEGAADTRSGRATSFRCARVAVRTRPRWRVARLAADRGRRARGVRGHPRRSPAHEPRRVAVRDRGLRADPPGHRRTPRCATARSAGW